MKFLLWREIRNYSDKKIERIGCQWTILWGQHFPNTKTRKDITKNENDGAISLINIDTKILNRVSASQIQLCIKRIIHYGQVIFISGIQGCFNIQKSINVIHHINKLKRILLSTKNKWPIKWWKEVKETEMLISKWKKPIWKGYIPYDSNYVTF